MRFHLIPKPVTCLPMVMIIIGLPQAKNSKVVVKNPLNAGCKIPGLINISEEHGNPSCILARRIMTDRAQSSIGLQRVRIYLGSDDIYIINGVHTLYVELNEVVFKHAIHKNTCGSLLDGIDC